MFFSLAQKAKQAILPWIKARKCNTKDLLIPTTVKPSLIKNGGFGRFANEFIPENTLFCSKKILDFNTCKYNDIFRDDVIILLSNENELSDLLNVYCKETNSPSKDILNGFSNFIASHDNNFCHINSISLCANHKPRNNGANITTFYDNGYLIGKTIADINKGKELYQDYNDFNLPQFFTNFCKQFNIGNVSMFKAY